jgi:hypothetical protein
MKAVRELGKLDIFEEQYFAIKKLPADTVSFKEETIE